MDAKQIATEFAGDLSRTLGGRLDGVMLYGSVARGEYIEGQSDINVLVLIDDIHGGSLATLSPIVRSYAKRGVHPIILESAEWRRATDVFAIEISDMHDAHQQLQGEDSLDWLPIALPILRLQAERELRGKLLQLYLAMTVTETPEELGRLLTNSMPSVVTYFRTALRLARRDVPAASADVLRAAAEVTGVDVATLIRVLDARRNGSTLTVSLSDPMVDAFNTSIEALVKFIDNFGR